MENILDYLFSSAWLLVITFFIVLFIFIIISEIKPFKNKLHNKIFKIISIIIPFLLLFGLYMVPFSYGFSYEISAICLAGDKICLIDRTDRGDEGVDRIVYRLHVLNSKTGKKLSRHMYSGINDINLINSSTVLLFSDSNFILVDIDNNKIIKKITREYIQSRFHELSKGIESTSYEKISNVDPPAYITVTTKTAKTYYYNLLTDKLLENSINVKNKDIGYYINNIDIICKKEDNFENRIVSLENKYGSYNLKHLQFYDTLINKSSEIAKTDFIDPKIIAIIPEKNLFFVVSYETTDDINYILHAVDFNGKEKWIINQSATDLANKTIKDAKLNCVVQFENSLIFNWGGFIVSADVNTGKINWEQRV